MHLAGHQHCGTHIIDTHDRPVVDEVWELFRLAWSLTGGTSTLLEWDGNIPSFAECMDELNKARDYMGEQLSVPQQPPVAVGEPALSTPIDFLVPDVMSRIISA
jgi:hypothetical protein